MWALFGGGGTGQQGAKREVSLYIVKADSGCRWVTLHLPALDLVSTSCP